MACRAMAALPTYDATSLLSVISKTRFSSFGVSVCRRSPEFGKKFLLRSRFISSASLEAELRPSRSRLHQIPATATKSNCQDLLSEEVGGFCSSHVHRNKVSVLPQSKSSTSRTSFSFSSQADRAPKEQVHWAEESFSTNGVLASYCYTMQLQELPIFVFLHGLTSSGPAEIPVLSELADEFRIFLPSARGHGKSQPIPAGSFTMSNLVSDAANAIKYFSPHAPVFLGGHSMGAATAARVAKLYPELVKGVLLEDPPWLRLPGEPIYPSSTAPNPFPKSRELKMLAPAEFADVNEIDGSKLKLNHPFAITETESLRLFDADTIEPTFRSTDDDINEAVADVKVPALLQTAGGAGVCQPEVAKKILTTWERGRERHYSEAGHLIHASKHQEEWLTDVRAFLSSLK